MRHDNNNPKYKHSKLIFFSNRKDGGISRRSESGSEGKTPHFYLEQNFSLPGHGASISY
jgi:hypothetical protein